MSNMYWMTVVLVCLAAGLPGADLHLTGQGQCPDIPVKQDFNVNKYLGTWYGQASFGTESTQGKGRCVTARYTYNDTANHVEIYNWQIPSAGYRASISGFSVPSDPSRHEGDLRVTFRVSDNRTNTFRLIVVDTDYENWSVVYYCKDLLHHHETSGWILTRVRDLDGTDQKVAIAAEVGQVLREANLSNTLYSTTDQKDCPQHIK